MPGAGGLEDLIRLFEGLFRGRLVIILAQANAGIGPDLDVFEQARGWRLGGDLEDALKDLDGFRHGRPLAFDISQLQLGKNGDAICLIALRPTEEIFR